MWWPCLHDKLRPLMQAVWRKGEVVGEWRNAVIVPVPKKGNLQSCDYWRAIILLDVMGKVMGRVILERLQVIT